MFKKQMNKWSKKFNERPHRCPVTPCGGEWNRQGRANPFAVATLTSSNKWFTGPTQEGIECSGGIQRIIASVAECRSLHPLLGLLLLGHRHHTYIYIHTKYKQIYRPISPKS